MKMTKENTIEEDEFHDILCKFGEYGLLDDIRDDVIELKCSYQFAAYAERNYITYYRGRYDAFGMRFKMTPTAGVTEIILANK
jgi:hypothetical protein